MLIAFDDSHTHRSVYKTYVEGLHFSHIDKDLKVETGPGDGTRAAPSTTGSGKKTINEKGICVPKSLTVRRYALTMNTDTSRQRGLHLPAERVEEIRRLSQDPMIYEKVRLVIVGIDVMQSIYTIF